MRRLQALALAVRRHRLAWALVQLAAVAIFLGSFALAAGDVLDEGLARARDADPVHLTIACLVLAAYYLLFVVGWQRILAGLGVRLGYSSALQAEMVSMLAKYIPGGIWTPAARVVAVRRAGVTDTPLVLVSIALEAGLSALSGVIVFALGVAMIGGADAPAIPLVLFSVACAVALHPRVFEPLARRLLRPFGRTEIRSLPYGTMLVLLAYYAVTWLLGGVTLYFLLRSVGADPGVTAIPFLAGTAAVGAIVAVLVVFAPSGLGVREASMVGLMLAVAPASAALGVAVLNRLAITVVEALLLLGSMVARARAPGKDAEPAEPSPASSS